MTRQLVKHLQIGSHWRIVIAIPVLLLLAGTVFAATYTVCTYRADKNPDTWLMHRLVQWVHCHELEGFISDKVLPAIEYVTKKFLAAEQKHPIKFP
jgi:hypothetical protein